MPDATSDTRVTVDRLDACLPQTQCTQCGYPRCRAYAEALAEGRAAVNQCPPGGEATIEALSALLRVPRVPPDPRFGAHKPRARAVIDEETCIGCRKCLDACPVDAIVGARKLMHTVIAAECTGCELCLPPCPVDCINMVPSSTAQTGETWPEYTHAETARWRVRTERRLERLARNRRRRRARSPGDSRATTVLPNDREQIRADIRAAIDRVKEKRNRRKS